MNASTIGMMHKKPGILRSTSDVLAKKMELVRGDSSSGRGALNQILPKSRPRQTYQGPTLRKAILGLLLCTLSSHAIAVEFSNYSFSGTGIHSYVQLTVGAPQEILTTTSPHDTVPAEENSTTPEIIIPDDISFYINRTLLSPHFITAESLDKIFKQYHLDPDVFLFTGIDLDQFKKLTNGRIVPSNSSEQAPQQWLTNKFILLEDPSHFNNISKKTERTLHWLHYERGMGKMRLVRSTGTVDIWDVNKLKSPPEVELSEDNFLHNFTTSDDGNSPICISGESPLAQSMFLSRIAKRLAEIYPDRNVVILPISDFISKFQNAPENATEEVLKNVLETEFGMNENVTSELLVYARDGIELPDHHLAFEILGKIKSTFESIRVWVTAGMERSYVESKLSLICHKIKPLSVADQVQILSKYWSRHENLNSSRLNEFANVHLEALNHGRNLKFKGLADTGLELTLLGEVYELEAREYALVSRNDSSPTPPLANVTYLTIADLYAKLIQMKMKKYQTSSGTSNRTLEDTQLMNMFASMSLQLYFPDKFVHLKEQLGQVDLIEVMKVGILEESEGSPKFKHLGLADYFLSWLALKGIKGETDFDQEEFIQYLNETVFSKRSKYSITYDEDGAGSIMGWTYEFDRENVAYFFDHFIQDLTPPPNNSIIRKVINFTDAQQISSWFSACASSSFINIPKLLDLSGAYRKILDEFGSFPKVPPSAFFEGHLLISAMHSNLEIFKVALAQFQLYNKMSDYEKAVVLFLTVQSGDFVILEYLVKEMELEEIVKEMRGHAKLLIANKIKIMRYLVGINPGLLEQRDEDRKNMTPILLPSGHVRLKIELIHLGANVLVRDSDNETLLYNGPSRSNPIMSRDQLQSLVLNIPAEYLAQLTTSTRRKECTLYYILWGIDPIPQTIEAFGRAGVDFNLVKSHEEYPLLLYSIERGVNADALRKMIEFGADVYWKGERNQTLLHFSAESGHFEATILLLNEYGFDVNARDRNGHTPLDYATKRYPYSTNIQRVYKTALALHERGGKLREELPLPLSIPNNGWNTFVGTEQMKVNRGNFDVLEVLHRIGKLPSRDRDGNTPLHLAVRYHPYDYPDIDHLSVTKLFLDNDRNWVNATNDHGEMPLQLALKNDYLDFETFQMLKSRTNMNWTTSLANHCLATVIRSGNAEQVVQLMKECEELGADYNFTINQPRGYPYYIPDVLGTPLHIAAGNCQERAVHYLVEEKGANISVRNGDQETPLLTAAARCKDTDAAVRIIKYLGGNGADVNVEKECGGKCFQIFLERSPRPLIYQWYELQEYLRSQNYTGSYHELLDDDKDLPYRFTRVTTRKTILVQNDGSMRSSYKIKKH